MTDRQPGLRGRIVTVVAAKAGCGKTTLATNLAAALGNGTRRVCVVDLDLTAGDVALLMGVRPYHTVTEAIRLPGKLIAGAVESLVTPIKPQLDGILVSATPGQSLPGAIAIELLAGLARQYDYVVVDTPALFGPHVLAALDIAHHQVVAVTPERPAVRDLRLMLDMFDLLSYPAGSRSVVLNRSDPLTGITAGDIEKAVKCSVAAELPSTVDVPASVNRGVPLAAAQPAHEYSRAVFRFVQEHITSVNEKGNTHA